MPNIPDIDTLIEKVMILEGDFSDHPADRGGPTRWGVTEAVGTGTWLCGRYAGFPARGRSSDLQTQILGSTRL